MRRGVEQLIAVTVGLAVLVVALSLLVSQTAGAFTLSGSLFVVTFFACRLIAADDADRREEEWLHEVLDDLGAEQVGDDSDELYIA